MILQKKTALFDYKMKRPYASMVFQGPAEKVQREMDLMD